jgi:hypothetical protein
MWIRSYGDFLALWMRRHQERVQAIVKPINEVLENAEQARQPDV